MKRLLFSIATLLWSLSLWAGPVTAEQARQKAIRFLQGNSPQGARRASPTKARQLKVAATGRDDSYYIFNVEDNGGFVVVSGEDATEEILGYSDGGNINPDNMPCGMKMLLDSYAEQIEYLRTNGITKEENTSAQNSEESYIIPKDKRTYYHQHKPYNYLIPKEFRDKDYPAGCVAIAMTGLLYAHKWPKVTTLEIPKYSWYDKEDHPWTLDGIPANTKIDWNNILESYKDYEDSDREDEKTFAIADLVRIVGTSVKTAYDAKGSGSDIEYIAKALKKYFDYDNSVKYLKRKNYSYEEWISMLREEIVNRGPVVYSGKVSWDNLFTNPEGHAFLLEGYKGEKFYVNFGWGDGSSENTLFLLDLIKAKIKDEDGNVIDANFVYNQEAIFNVKPTPHSILEATEVYLDRADFTEFTITSSSAQGRITFTNKGEAQNSKLSIMLTEVETGRYQKTDFDTNILPDDSGTYNFSFSGLTVGNHYVLSALDIFGEVVYHSAELLCVDSSVFTEPEAEDDSGPRQLARFEYWFDNDFSGRQSITLSKSGTVVRDAIDTNELDDGLHRLNYRVLRDDGRYSAVSSSSFLKLSKEEKGSLSYWIDDNRDKMTTLDLADTDDDQLLELDLTDVAPGYHQLNIQVAMAGSALGTVYSTGVIKLSTAPANQLEYWFDDNIADSKRLTGKRAEGGDAGFIYTEEIDMSSLSPGFHRLNMRPVSGYGQSNGAVMSRPVLKLSNAVADHLEYWFDGDMTNIYQLSGQRAEGGESGYIYDCDFDLSSLSQGLHRLSLRATSSDGTNKSMVVENSVLKLSGGDATTLEYWFDGNRNTVRTLTGRRAEGGSLAGIRGCIFTNELNLEGIAPGHHRLYYRGVSADGNAATAVSTASVVVSVEHSSQEPATLVAYTLTLDDETVVAEGTLDATGETMFTYVLDTEGLTETNHTLTATFWNSFGESITQESVFYAGVLTADGDVNGDGSVDVGDVMAVINCMAGAGNADPAAADVNGDGTVDVGDVMAVINKMAGL